VLFLISVLKIAVKILGILFWSDANASANGRNLSYFQKLCVLETWEAN
jgi:hypothetical protein